MQAPGKEPQTLENFKRSPERSARPRFTATLKCKPLIQFARRLGFPEQRLEVSNIPLPIPVPQLHWPGYFESHPILRRSILCSMEVFNTDSQANLDPAEVQTPDSSGSLQGLKNPAYLPQAATVTASRQGIPGLTDDYHIVLQAAPTPMEKVARLKVLGDRRSAASLGLFVVLFFGLTLTILAIGEALRLALPGAGALLDMAMTLTLIVMLLSPIVLAALLGISLGQAIRQPQHRRNPDLERRWLLQRGDQTVGQLRLLPEALRLRLLWVNLQANHRGQGIGSGFVRAVLQTESMSCRVKLSGSSGSAPIKFFQRCGFQLPTTTDPKPAKRSPWSKQPSLWMTYDPKPSQH